MAVPVLDIQVSAPYLNIQVALLLAKMEQTIYTCFDAGDSSVRHGLIWKKKKKTYPGKLFEILIALCIELTIDSYVHV